MNKIITLGPNGGVSTFTSAAALSRVLSGNGSDSRRKTIARRIAVGGGYVGEVYVAPSRRRATR